MNLLNFSWWEVCGQSDTGSFVGSLFFLESFRILSYNYFEIQVYSVSLWFVHLDSIMAFDCRKFWILIWPHLSLSYMLLCLFFFWEILPHLDVIKCILKGFWFCLPSGSAGKESAWVRALGWNYPLEKGKATHSKYSGLENSMNCIVHGGRKESDTTEPLLLSLLSH